MTFPDLIPFPGRHPRESGDPGFCDVPKRKRATGRHRCEGADPDRTAQFRPRTSPLLMNCPDQGIARIRD